MKFYFYFFWSQGWAAVCCTHAHVCEFWAFWAEQLANWRWFLREWVTFNLASSPFLSSLISIDSGPSLIFAQQLPTDCFIFIAAYTWPRSHNRLNFLLHVFQHSTTQRASETYQCFPAWNRLAWLLAKFQKFYSWANCDSNTVLWKLLTPLNSVCLLNTLLFSLSSILKVKNVILALVFAWSCVSFQECIVTPP